jgi:alpha-N-arabinofuranosidase
MMLAEASRVETLIRDHWAAMGEVDRKHRVKLVVDEWGAWHRPGTEVDPTHLFGQQSTIRNAVLAGLSLDVFNRHVDKVAMANVAQLVNNLHSLFFAHEDRFAVTPTYHVFDMYQVHQGARSVRVEFAGTPLSHAGRARTLSLPALSGSASVRDRRLTLTVTNLDAGQPREASIDLRGVKPTAAAATTLTAATLDEVNTFDAPDRVRPKDGRVTLPREGSLTCVFPPASVTRLQFDLP